MPTANSGSISLFLRGPVASSGNDSLNLFTWGTTNSGIRNFTTLFLEADDAIYPNQAITLYTKAPNGTINNNISLYLESHYDRANNSLNLYVNGPNVLQNSGLELYIRGNGITDNSVPFTGSIPLFIQRVNPDSTANNISLYVNGPSQLNNNLTLNIFGAYILNSGLSLYVSGHPIQYNNSINLYSHGF